MTSPSQDQTPTAPQPPVPPTPTAASIMTMVREYGDAAAETGDYGDEMRDALFGDVQDAVQSLAVAHVTAVRERDEAHDREAHARRDVRYKQDACDDYLARLMETATERDAQKRRADCAEDGWEKTLNDRKDWQIMADDANNALAKANTSISALIVKYEGERLRADRLDAFKDRVQEIVDDWPNIRQHDALMELSLALDEAKLEALAADAPAATPTTPDDGEAAEILCRIFTDGADEAHEEWQDFIAKGGWLNWSRGLGAFIGQRVRERPDRLYPAKAFAPAPTPQYMVAGAMSATCQHEWGVVADVAMCLRCNASAPAIQLPKPAPAPTGETPARGHLSQEVWLPVQPTTITTTAKEPWVPQTFITMPPKRDPALALKCPACGHEVNATDSLDIGPPLSFGDAVKLGRMEWATAEAIAELREDMATLCETIAAVWGKGVHPDVGARWMLESAVGLQKIAARLRSPRTGIQT